MKTAEPSVSDMQRRGSDALQMLAHGSPLGRTLDAAATIATGMRPGIRCGILLIDDDRLTLAGGHSLQDADRSLLEPLCLLSVNEFLTAMSRQENAEVRPLVTSAAELLGVLVLFASATNPSNEKGSAEVDEACSIATLAVEGKHILDDLYFRAHHDPLTRIWNRLWMGDEVGRVLEDSAGTNFLTGLMLIGIDSFRIINELLGSQIGNDLLREIAIRLTKTLRPGWSLARCGGDEFMILVPSLVDADEVRSIAAEVLAVFDMPFEIGDHELLVRASIGTSVSPPGGCRPDDLQNRAESALRYGKRCARGRVSPFSAAMISTPPERLEMERHLRFALPKREFELYYQPQVHLPTGKIIGVEALLRWRHPFLGFISPASFVPIAEQIGIIDEIGDWVLGEAVQQLAKWHRAGLDGLRMAVNVSAIQFSREDFAGSVAKLLRRTDISPHDLELEITESAVMTNFEHGARQMKHLRSLGVLTALDDFGTGHSSLAYLQQLPIQRLKIDRMFVKDLASATQGHPLLSSIIQMGRALGCAVIAEGIETAEQARALAELECDEVQGYFFSKPLPADEILAWAKAR